MGEGARTGGCLCGALRYACEGPPKDLLICYCRFCQRATGGAGMVEAIWWREQLRVTEGTPAVFTQPSAGSGLEVHAQFCAACGTRLWLTFERFPEVAGIYAGTLDDPDAMRAAAPEPAHLYVSKAQPGTVIPAGEDWFAGHATRKDGTANTPQRFDRHMRVDEALKARLGGDG